MKKSKTYVEPTFPKYDINTITSDMVKRVYSGRPGCGCGCNGNYSETKTAKTRILNELKKNTALVGQNYCGLDDEMCFFLETDARYRWVYVPIVNLKKEHEVKS